MISRKVSNKYDEEYRQKLKELMRKHSQPEQCIEDILRLPITDKQKYDIMVDFLEPKEEEPKEDEPKEDEPKEEETKKEPQEIEI